MPTNNAFEEQFRERFTDMEEAPPAFAWNKIQKEIEPAASVKAKKSLPKFQWLMPGAVIAVISVALLFMLKYNKAIEQEKVRNGKEVVLQAETQELKEPTTEIVPEVADSKPKADEKTAFKAYKEKTSENLASNNNFLKKRYLKGAEKSERLKVASSRKKLKATQVVYVVTVDPKSTSVEKISTAVPDSAAAPSSAN